MPVDVKWLNNSRTCILGTFEGYWTALEFTTAIETLAGLLEDSAGDVYIIVDGSKSMGISKSINVITLIHKVFTLPFRHIIIVPSSPITRLVLNMLTQANRRWKEQITFVATFSEAVNLFERFNLIDTIDVP